MKLDRFGIILSGQLKIALYAFLSPSQSSGTSDTNDQVAGM